MADLRAKTSAAPKVFEDRVQADAETVSHVLEPNRTSDNILYPDPPLANADGQTAPDSIADIQIARRTDAGAYQAGSKLAVRRTPMWFWIATSVALLVIVALIALL